MPAVPGNLVEKIRDGIYVDFPSLLPENMAEQFKDEKEKKKKPIPVETFPDWALSFALYAATVVAEKPEKALELFTYLGVVTRLARDANFGETHRLEYDIQFREKAAALCGEVKWAALDQDLLQWARKSKMRRLNRTCISWNAGRFCQNYSCRFDHMCSTCGRDNPVIKCKWNRMTNFRQPYTSMEPRRAAFGGSVQSSTGNAPQSINQSQQRFSYAGGSQNTYCYNTYWTCCFKIKIYELRYMHAQFCISFIINSSHLPIFSAVSLLVSFLAAPLYTPSSLVSLLASLQSSSSIASSFLLQYL